MDLENLFISGSKLGDTDLTCYLPIFKASDDNSDTWILGNLIMQDYYVVFDMTPFDERNETFI